MGNPYYTWGGHVDFHPLPSGVNPGQVWTVAANQDGHLEIFAIGLDGAVWHMWQDYADVFTWSDWVTFGTPNAATSLAVSIHAVQNLDGRVEVFALDQEWNVWHIWQIAANANWSTEWVSLGRPDDQLSAGNRYSIQVSKTDSGAIAVLAQNTGSLEVFSRSQVQANGGWEAGWTSLGTISGDFTIATPPRSLLTNVVGVNVGNPCTFYVNQKSSFIEGEAQWSGWGKPFSGPQGVDYLSNLVLQWNQDNRLELFATDTAKNLWHTWQTDQFVWTGEWASFNTPPNGSQPGFSCALGPGSMLSAVTRSGQNAIYLVSQTAANNGWGGWNIIWPDPDPDNLENPQLQLITDQNGSLNIFGLHSNGLLFYIPQIFHSS